MQIIHENTSVKTNILSSDKVDFGISKNGAKIFSMLGSTLYSNPEQAVLYELGANCLDAHRLVGKEDTPWTLVLPTTLDPHVKFRDYGPGLLEQQVKTLLTTYGESTKSGTNDDIGGFGIGSKSPAAVSSTWNIVSHHSGTMKEYIVFIDRTGIPSLTKIRDCATEESGLEVIIPVPPAKISAWVDGARTCFTYYDVKPEIKSFSKDTFSKSDEVILSGDGWDVVKRSDYYTELLFISTQRNYIPDSEILRREFKDEKFLALLRTQINIKFPTGELDFSLSREKLQYNKHTIAAIGARLKTVYTELAQKIQDVLNSAKDRLEYLELARTLGKIAFRSASDYSILWAATKGNKWGLPINSWRDLEYFKIRDIDKSHVFRASNRYSTKTIEVGKFKCWGVYCFSVYDIFGDPTNILEISIPKLSRISVVHVVKEDKFLSGKVRHAIKQGKLKEYVLIWPISLPLPNELKPFSVESTSLESPPKTQKEVKKIKSDIWEIGRNSFQKLERRSLSAYKTFVGIEFSNARTISPGLTVNAADYELYNKIKCHVRYHNLKMVGVKSGAFPADVIPIKQFALAEFNRLNTKELVGSNYYCDLYQWYRRCIGSSTAIAIIDECLESITNKDSVLFKLANMLKKVKTGKGNKSHIDSDYSYLLTLSECLKKPILVIDDSVTRASIEKIHKVFYTEFSMLNHVATNNIPNKILIDYINLVGK